MCVQHKDDQRDRLTMLTKWCCYVSLIVVKAEYCIIDSSRLHIVGVISSFSFLFI